MIMLVSGHSGQWSLYSRPQASSISLDELVINLLADAIALVLWSTQRPVPTSDALRTWFPQQQPQNLRSKEQEREKQRQRHTYRHVETETYYAIHMQILFSLDQLELVDLIGSPPLRRRLIVLSDDFLQYRWSPSITMSITEHSIINSHVTQMTSIRSRNCSSLN